MLAGFTAIESAMLGAAFLSAAAILWVSLKALRDGASVPLILTLAALFSLMPIALSLAAVDQSINRQYCQKLPDKCSGKDDLK